ncbi:MAG: DUF2141 domain-containing protein [Pseudomonadota bacterium]|nr:DUF2141 domain-containing protein [Pseudomonadota bacterium]
MKQFIRYAIVAALAATSLAQAADMTIDIAGLKNARGKVMVAVYDRADNFLKQPMRTSTVDAQAGTVHMLLTGLPAGDYAISLYHDENGNGKLDKNPLGMPIESYGFSNDAAGNYGPPSFQQAQVHLLDTGTTVTVNLR